jgi:phospholipase/carboxylesterase
MAFKIFAPFTKLQSIIILSVYALLVLYGTGILQTVILVKEPSIFEYPPISGEKPDKIIFLVHGANNDADSMWPLAYEIAPYFKDALFIIPEAREPSRVLPYTLSWYNRGVKEVTELGDKVENAVPFLVKRIEKSASGYNIPYQNIAIIGYSQGSTISLNAVHKLKEPIGALISLSGYVGGEDEAYQEAFQHNLKLFLLHGKRDYVVPISEMYRIKEHYRAQGAPVSAHVIDDLGHDINEEMVARAISYLQLIWPESI